MSDPKRSQLGNGLAVGLYALLFTYLVVIGFASVIPPVFFAKGDPSFADRDCNGGLSELRRDIEDKRLDFLTGKRHNLVQLRNELSRWDARLTTLEEKCGRDATDPLLQYRHRVELSIERYLREDGSMARELNMTVPSEGAKQ